MKRSTLDTKIYRIVTATLALAIVVMALLYLAGVWEGAVHYFVPASGAMQCIMGFYYRKISRAVSILSFVSAGIIALCSILLFIL